MSTSQTRLVLVVDDDQPVRESVCKALSGKGYEVTGARNGREALSRLAQSEFDAMILDIAMPEMDGVELMRHIRVQCPDAVMIVLTAMPDRAGFIGPTALALGAAAVLRKPVHVDDLSQTIEAAIMARSVVT